MLQIEPLRSLLQEKWDRFASTLFLINFLFYLSYLGIFTTVAFYRKQGQVTLKTTEAWMMSSAWPRPPSDPQPPFPIEHVPLDYFRSCGEGVSVFGAACLLYKAVRRQNLVQQMVHTKESAFHIFLNSNWQIVIFKRNPPKLKTLYMDGFCDIIL